MQKYAFEKLKEISKDIKMLIKEKKYKEALVLCTDDVCQQSIVIQRQMKN